MELRAYVPSFFGYLNNLYQIGCGIDAHTLHTGILIFLLIYVIKLVTVTMTLFDELRVES
jgi:hypothetical protein